VAASVWGVATNDEEQRLGEEEVETARDQRCEGDQACNLWEVGIAGR
jgi:hypothetical protein